MRAFRIKRTSLVGRNRITVYKSLNSWTRKVEKALIYSEADAGKVSRLAGNSKQMEIEILEIGEAQVLGSLPPKAFKEEFNV